MLPACHSPADVYRRVDFDARVQGATPQQLVAILIDEVIEGLRSAVFANSAGLGARKSAAMTRAIASLVALEIGVDSASGSDVAASLIQFYRSGKKVILDSVLSFDLDAINRVTADFEDVRRAMQVRA